VGLSYEHWVEVGRRLAGVASASAWWLGDWLLYGQRTYGDRYKAAIQATQLDYQTLRNYAWGARSFDVSRRRDSLSFQHHAELAGRPEPEQELWLQRAERAHWSRNELRRQMRRARLERPAPGTPRNRDVVVRVEVPDGREQRWRRAATMAEQGFLEWITSIVDAAAEETLGPDEEEEPEPGPALSALPAGA
jgi:hypothetical protein